MEINGLEELSNRLDTMAKNAEELNGTHSYPLPEILTDKFMEDHSRFKNINDFLIKIGINNNEDLEKYPDDKMDEYVAAETDFGNWHDMLNTASKEFVARKLGF